MTARNKARKGVPGTDFLSVKDRSNLMRRVKSERTLPEVTLASALHDLGLIFETHVKDLPGKPDIVFRDQKLTVFVDGEFWHGAQWWKRGLKSLDEQFPDLEKRARWIKKIKRNAARDLDQTAALVSTGWKVVRLWANDVETRLEHCVAIIRNALTRQNLPSPATIIAERTVAEFFAGIGLARLGLEASGWRVIFANDFSKDKLHVYQSNFTNDQTNVDDRDVKEINASEIPTVSLATACFPCTDLSLAGGQLGIEHGKQSSAYLGFTALLEDLKERRPPFVLLENVLGMINSRDGLDFQICLQRLANAGYRVDPFVLDAKWFVPQSRPRLFIAAVRSDLPLSGHSQTASSSDISPLRPKRLIEFIEKHPELPFSLRQLPLPAESKKHLSNVLEEIKEGDARWWSDKRREALFAQMSDKHKDAVREMMNSRQYKYATAFRRMRNGKSMAEIRTDGIAGCLRTPKGGSAKQILLRAARGKLSVRHLTPVECARLMGAESIFLPDSTSVNAALFAFGDGVCVPAVNWILDHYFAPAAAELLRGSILWRASA